MEENENNVTCCCKVGCTFCEIEIAEEQVCFDAARGQTCIEVAGRQVVIVGRDAAVLEGAST